MQKTTWTDQDLNGLGKMSDQTLANRMIVSVGTVRNKRLELKIPPFRSQVAQWNWSAQDIALLGTMSDNALAKKLGVSVGAVQQKRFSNQIQPYRKKIAVTPEANPDRTEKKSNRIRVLSEVEQALLGAMTDVNVAKLTGKPISTIKQVRHRLRIAAYTLPLSTRYTIPARSSIIISWTELDKLNQHDFFKRLSEAYSERTERKLTFRKVSSLTLWDVSQLKKWFVPSDLQHPLPITAKQHIWLAVVACF